MIVERARDGRPGISSGHIINEIYPSFPVARQRYFTSWTTMFRASFVDFAIELLWPIPRGKASCDPRVLAADSHPRPAYPGRPNQNRLRKPP